jgi:putative ABC transport system permease protein
MHDAAAPLVPPPVAAPRERPLPSEGALAGAGRALRARGDDLLLSLGALSAHPLRSVLTLLGIVIGVFTVVSMMALTTGLQRSIDKGMGWLGANTFQITKWPPLHFGPMDPSIWRRKPIALQQAMALRESLPQSVQVSPEAWRGGQLMESRWGKAQPVTVAGGAPEMFSNNNLPMQHGRIFSEHETQGGARIVVLGANVADAVFPRMDPLGQKVRLGRMELEVVGVLERQGGNPLGWTPDGIVVIPLVTFIDLYGGGRSLDISVMAASKEEVPRVQDAAVSALRRIRGLKALEENDFEVFSNDSLRNTFDDLANTVTLATVCICALSLVVGGIGVMNIMLVAVAERTREIGLRKALGARRSRILAQFVIESILLASCGGVIGIVLGYAAAWLAGFAFALPAEVPLWSVGLGLGVSCGIGLVFGIYPAARASQLDPAVALRSE